MSGTDYNYDEQGQFFPYFILTVTTLVTVPTTISFLRPSKGARFPPLPLTIILMHNQNSRIPERG
jgi:preprotein translocase subunit Sec63